MMSIFLGSFAFVAFVFFAVIAHMTDDDSKTCKLTQIAALFLIAAIIGLK